MNGWRGLAAGALTLVALQRLVNAASDSASGAHRVAGLLQLPVTWAQRFMDPTIPALHKKASATPAKTTPKK